MKTTKQTRDELRAAISGNGAVAMSLSLLSDLLDDVEEQTTRCPESSAARVRALEEAAAELQAIVVTDSYVRPSSRVGRAIEKFMAVAQPGEKAGDALAAIVECNALKDALGKLIYAAEYVREQGAHGAAYTALMNALDYAKQNIGPERRVAGVSTEPLVGMEKFRELQAQLYEQQSMYQAQCDDKAKWISKATQAERECKKLQFKLNSIANFVDSEAKR